MKNSRNLIIKSQVTVVTGFLFFRHKDNSEKLSSLAYNFWKLHATTPCLMVRNLDFGYAGIWPHIIFLAFIRRLLNQGFSHQESLMGLEIIMGTFFKKQVKSWF